MAGDFIYERKCELGYWTDLGSRKFNEYLEPLNYVELTKLRDFSLEFETVSLEKLPSIGIEFLALKSPAITALLDHLITLEDDKEYTLYEVHVFSKTRRGTKLKNYPKEASHFVECIDYAAFEMNYPMEELEIPDKNILDSWIQNSKDWVPLKVENVWQGCLGGALKIKKFKAFEKFRILDAKAEEPYILDSTGKKILFGLVDMSSAEKKEEVYSLQQFRIKCPQKCSNDSRNWICDQCGDYLSFSHVESLQLQCSCGNKDFTPEMFTCVNPRHLKSSSQNNSSIPRTNPETHHDDSKSLASIRSQLKKLLMNNEEVNKEEINRVLKELSDSRERNQQILRSLNRNKFDGDTKNLIEEYCRR